MGLNPFAPLFFWVPKRRDPRPATRRLRRRLEVESLEARTLLSGEPILGDDFGDTDGRNPVPISVLANDTDADDAINPRTLMVTQPAHGTVTVNRDTGDVTYKAFANFGGTDTFFYRVKDDNGDLSARATVTVIVHRPAAADDFADTDGTNPVPVDVLNNDRDPDGALDPATVKVVRQPLHGTVSVNPSNGQITYTPRANFSGSDTFDYQVADEHGALSNTARVSLIVHLPKANNDFATTGQGNPVTVDVLENDKDPDGALVEGSVAVVRPPQHGTFSINPSTGAVTYTPNPSFHGTDTFTYTVNDEHGATSAPAAVSVVVLGSGAVNDDVADTDGHNPVLIPVLLNDVLPPGGVRNLQVFGGPAHGTAMVQPGSNQVIYHAYGSFIGTDSFSYRVIDQSGRVFGVGRVTVVVNAPTANDDFADTDGTNPVPINVLGNDTDPDGSLDATSVRVVNGPKHGTVSVNPSTGEVTYTPKAGYTGSDSFTYRMKDEHGAGSNKATVRLIVHNPTANDDFNQGSGPVVVDLLANDTDPDGALDPNTVVVTRQPAHGNVFINTSTGQATYTPATGFKGTDRFFYTVQDENGSVSNVAQVTVIVV